MSNEVQHSVSVREKAFKAGFGIARAIHGRERRGVKWDNDLAQRDDVTSPVVGTEPEWPSERRDGWMAFQRLGIPVATRWTSGDLRGASGSRHRRVQRCGGRISRPSRSREGHGHLDVERQGSNGSPHGVPCPVRRVFRR